MENQTANLYRYRSLSLAGLTLLGVSLLLAFPVSLLFAQPQSDRVLHADTEANTQKAVGTAGETSLDKADIGDKADARSGLKQKKPLDDPRTYPLMILLIVVSMMGFFIMLGVITMGRRQRERLLKKGSSLTRLNDMTEFSDEERQLKAIIEQEKQAMVEGVKELEDPKKRDESGKDES